MDPTSDPSPFQPLLSADWLLDTMPWGILVVDEQHTIRRVNQQAARWGGVVPAALLGQPVAEAPLPPNMRVVLTQLLEAASLGPIEVLLPASERWITCDATRQPGGWVVYGQDITPQKQREQQYQALAENTPDVLTRWTPDLRLRYANAALATKVGAPLAALLHQTKREMGLPEEVAGPYMAALQRVFDTGEPQELYHPLPTPHGTLAYHSRLVPELRDGEIETVLGIARDLTELHQTQAEALRLRDALTQQATDKYHALFQRLNQGFCVLEILFDAAGQRAVGFNPLEVNPQFAQESGMAAYATGDTPRELVPALDDFWLAAYGQVVRTGEAQRLERYEPKVSRWFEVHAFRIGPPAAHQVAVLFSDVTARKQAEQRQQYVMQLTDALRPLADPLAIQREALAVLRAHLGSTRTLYAEALDQEGTMYISTENRDPGLVPMEGLVMRFQDFTPDGLAEAKAGHPLWRNDVLHEAQTPKQQAGTAAFGTRAWLMVPLVKNGHLVADLTVHSATARTWTAHDIALVQETTERTWAAVERAKAEEALRLHQQRTRRQKEAFQAAINEEPLANSLNILAQLVKEQVGREVRTAFYLAYPDGASLHAIAGAGDMPDTYTTALDGFPTGETSFCSGYAIAAGCPVHTPDVRADPAWQPYWELAASHQFRACSSYPILTREGKAIGSVALYFAGMHEATPQEAAVAEAVAQAAGIILSRHAQTAERARAEAALRESEAQFRAVANLGPDLLWRSSPDNETTWYNQRWHEYTGQTLEEAAGAGWKNVVHPDDQAESSRRYQAAIAIVQPLRLEHRFRSAQGEYRWFQVRATPLLGEHGAVTAWYGAATDIHARKLAEEALRQSEEKYRTLFETMDEGFAIYELKRDESGNVVDMLYRETNESYARLTGLTNVVGRWASELIPNLEPSWFEKNRRVADTGIAIREEDYIAELDRWFSVHHSRIGGAGSHLMAAVFDNITERKQRERQQAFLLLFSDALRAETNVAAVANRALQLLIKQLGLDRSYITTYYLDANRAEVDYQLGNDSVPPLPAYFVLSDYPEAFTATLTNTVVIEDDWERQGLSEAEKRNSKQLGMRAMVGATLRKENKPLWSLVAISSQPRRWTPGEIALLEEVAERIWVALESARAEDALRASQAQLAELNAQLEQRVAKRTQQLQTSRDLLQSVLDTSLVSMSVLYAVRDETGQVQDFRIGLVNKKLESETGRTDLVGKLYAQEYPGVRRVGVFDLMLRALATNEPQTLEYFYDHEGFNRWYTCQFVKMGDGVVATNLDITERKAAEQERLNNLRLLEQAEAVAGLGSWDYDLATGAMRWSDGMYHLVDLPLGQPVSPAVYLQLVADDDRPRAEQLVQQLTSGQSADETLRLRVGEQVKTVRLKAVVLRDEANQAARVLGVDLDISELQRLEVDNLRLRLGQQQALFEAVQAAQEEERRRMSESLHNGIGQLLYATKLQLDRLPADADFSPRHRAAELLSQAIRQTRALSHELTPATLEEFGLEATLRSMCQMLNTPVLQWHCHFDFEESPPLPVSLQLALYRLAQELVQNVLKHAQATQATLEAEILPSWAVLRVEDNGRGFDPSTSSDGLGLRTLRSRVALLGGSMQLTAAPDQGAQCQIRLPLTPQRV